MDAAVLLARRSCSPGRGRQAGASDRADYQPDAPTRQPPSALRRRDEPRPPADAVAGYLEARARGVAAPAFFRVALRANEDETSAHQEFSLEGAEG